MADAPESLQSVFSARREAATSASSPWWSVVAMMLALTSGAGALTHYAFGAFIKNIEVTEGWSRSWASGGIGLFTVAIAIGAPLFAILVDRYGPRRPALASVTAAAALLAGMSQVDSELAFVGVFIVLGLVSGGTLALPYSKAIAARFDKHRGLAFGLGGAGVGLGGIVLPHYVAYLLQQHGWRVGFVGLAISLLAVSLPAIHLGLPRQLAAQPRAAHAAAQEAPAFRPWRERAFWLIAASMAFISMGVSAVIVHAVPLMTDRGMSPAAAAGVMSSIALVSALGRISGGWFMDVFFAPRVTLVLFLTAALGVGFLLLGESALWMWLGVICIGFVAGAETDAMTYLISRYFDVDVFGRVFGIMMLVFSAGSGTGVFVMGRCFDLFGSYTVGLVGVIALATTAAILASRLGPYRNPIGH